MHVFRDLLVTAMEEAHIRVGGLDHLAVQFENQAQHAVGGRMGRPHVQDHPLADEVIRFRMIVVRGAGGAGVGVGCLDFLNSGAHA